MEEMPVLAMVGKNGNSSNYLLLIVCTPTAPAEANSPEAGFCGVAGAGQRPTEARTVPLQRLKAGED